MKGHLSKFLVTVALVGTPAAGQTDGDWSAYGRTALGDRHSPLSRLTPENVHKLKIAWRYKTGCPSSQHLAQIAA